MKTKQALFLSMLITLFLALNILILPRITRSSNIYTARVVDVKDGDTIRLETGKTIRLANINSPEKSSPLHKPSKEFLNNYLNKTIKIEALGIDKYGRELARIYSLNGDYINLQLVSLGIASKFLVDSSEVSKFSSAEKEAIKLSKGIWKHSNYYGCFNVEIDKYDEFVTITDDCKINIKGFKIKDESRKTYIFKKTEENKIILHSKQGEDNSTDIYWNSKQNIWNNDRDSIYIFDKDDFIVFYDSYGY